MSDCQNNYDQLYAKGVRARFPNEMLIRFINSRFAPQSREGRRILDLGFGTGRHLVYLAQEGFETYGIEGSANGAAVARQWLSSLNLSATISVGSFVEIAALSDSFDAVIDVASIETNSYETVARTVEEARRVLKPGGYLFSYFKTKDDTLWKESKKVDGRTCLVSGSSDKADTDFVLCCLSREDVSDLFAAFGTVSVEKEEWTYNGMKDKVSHWIVVAQK